MLLPISANMPFSWALIFLFVLLVQLAEAYYFTESMISIIWKIAKDGSANDAYHNSFVVVSSQHESASIMKFELDSSCSTFAPAISHLYSVWI